MAACTNCGSPLPEASLFCPNCGTSAATVHAAPQAAYAQAAYAQAAHPQAAHPQAAHPQAAHPQAAHPQAALQPQAIAPAYQQPAPAPAGYGQPPQPAAPAGYGHPPMAHGQPAAGVATVVVRRCLGCGSNLAPTDTQCALCSATPSGHEPQLAAPQGGLYWVQVRVQLKCINCGQHSPVNHLDHDGLFFCGTCGREQPFDPDLWHEYILPGASAAGDAFWSNMQVFPAWPDGELEDDDGIFGEYEGLKAILGKIGVDRARLRIEMSGMVISDVIRSTSFIAECFPGNPLCPNCRTPWHPSVDQPGVITGQCTQCGTRESYRLQGNLLNRANDCMGAMAPDHAQGRPEVRLEADAGSAALAIKCGGCGAPLQVSAGQHFAQCTYCSTASLIPDRVMARATGSARVQPWWLAFRAPSRMRQALQKSAREEEAKAAQRQESQRQKQAEAEQRAEERAKEKAAEAKRKRNGIILVLLLAPVILALMAIPLVLTRMNEAEKIAKAEAAIAALPDSTLLDQFNFELSTAEAAKLFGVPASSTMKVEFKPTGLIRRATISRGTRLTYGIEIDGGEALDASATGQRLAQLAKAPFAHKVERMRLGVGRALLEFDPTKTPSYAAVQRNASLRVSTQYKDDARAKAAINALWAIAHYAVTGKNPPTADQTRWLVGLDVDVIENLDLSVPVEAASKTFLAKVEYGQCQTVTDLMSKKTFVQCAFEPKHPFIRSVELAWPNDPGASIERASFYLKAPANKDIVKKCLESKLGTGEQVVIDHASGATQQQWKIGKKGDLAALGSWFFITAPAKRKLAKPPEWLKEFDEMVGILAKCQ